RRARMALRARRAAVAHVALPGRVHRQPHRRGHGQDARRRGGGPVARGARSPSGGRQPRLRAQHAWSPDRRRRRLDPARPGGIGGRALPARAPTAGNSRRRRLEPSRRRPCRDRAIRRDRDRPRRRLPAPDAQERPRDRDGARAAALGQRTVASGRPAARAAARARARRRARGRRADHDREGLGAFATTAAAAPAALRLERSARRPDGRDRMAASVPARVPVKIAVRLPNWLGDTVMAVPAIRSVRDTFPEAQVLLAGPWVGMLAGQGLGDVLVAYPRAWGPRLRAADTVRSFASDTVVLFPNSFEAAATAMYWGGRRRIGFAGDGRRWLLTESAPLPEPRVHQIDEYLRLVELLGAVTTGREPRLTPPEPHADGRQRARDLLHQSGAAEG